MITVSIKDGKAEVFWFHSGIFFYFSCCFVFIYFRFLNTKHLHSVPGNTHFMSIVAELSVTTEIVSV